MAMKDLLIRYRRNFRKLRAILHYFLFRHRKTVARLSSYGITGVRAYRVKQWVRHIDKNVIRYYYDAKFNGVRCFVKISSDSTAQNELFVNKYATERGIGFIPKLLMSSEISEGGTFMAVMEFVQGMRKFELPNDMPAFIKLCEEFENIHRILLEACIIHSDISKSNLMLDENGHIILIDFGIGKAPGSEVFEIDYQLHGGTYYADSGNTRTYDDAYSFLRMLDDSGITDIYKQLNCYTRLLDLVGTHSYSISAPVRGANSR